MITLAIIAGIVTLAMVFCTPGNGEGDGSVAVDIGYWIEV